MRYTVKKTFAAAAATGNALLVRVKDNQPRLLESLAGLCAVQPPIDHLDTIDHHAHGREEHRRIEVFAAERLDPDWQPFVACIVRVTRRTWCRDTRTGLWRQRREVAYYAGQVPLEARARARLRRLAGRLNDTPRRCLGYYTPREVFEQHLAAPPGPP